MNTKVWVVLAALAGAACISLPAAAGDGDFKSETFPLERNLAVDIAAPGAVRAEIGIAIPSLREELRFELGVDQQGQLAGGDLYPARRIGLDRSRRVRRERRADLQGCGQGRDRQGADR